MLTSITAPIAARIALSVLALLFPTPVISPRAVFVTSYAKLVELLREFSVVG
jgi:hypothetical protein